MTRTLLVDGNSLLNTGFHGIKNMYNGDNHIGGLYHFLNTLRKLIDSYVITKVVVFWDGKENTKPRTQLYPEYKLNRRLKVKPKEDLDSYARQKLRTQEYLEELYVRQATFKWCEADDCIGYYCHNNKEEEIIILTSDRDLLQLISKKVSLHVISLNKVFRFNDKVPLEGVYIPSNNVRLVKTICGDSSDNIFSAYPGVRTKSTKKRIGLLEAFEDMDSKGYAWNNLMLQHWTDHNELEHRVLDDYERNKQLIDLTQQPDSIKESTNHTINTTITSKDVGGVGIHFLRFCGKYDLVSISNQPDQYANWLNKTYKGVLND